MAKFKTGTLVRSKAGGPKLLVDSVYIPPAIMPHDDTEPRYGCIWWVGSKRHHEQFGENGLEAWSEGA